MKYPEVKMGFGFWWRRLEFCHSHEGWVRSLSNADGVTWDIHLCRTTKKRNLYFEMMGEFSSLLSLSVMSKISPCPRMGFPSRHCPVLILVVTLTLQAFAFTVSPFRFLFIYLFIFDYEKKSQSSEPTHFLVPTTIWK